MSNPSSRCFASCRNQTLSVWSLLLQNQFSVSETIILFLESTKSCFYSEKKLQVCRQVFFACSNSVNNDKLICKINKKQERENASKQNGSCNQKLVTAQLDFSQLHLASCFFQTIANYWGIQIIINLQFFSCPAFVECQILTRKFSSLHIFWTLGLKGPANKFVGLEM